MASEKFANLAETTLASDYTSGGASITVASATGFPTTGVFRVRLGNTAKTIYRVDSVAGAVFTGGAEANDGNATTGQTVVNVGSRGAIERMLQSPEAASIMAPSGISAADAYGPLWKIADPGTPAWAWQNQGGASVVQAGGLVFLTIPSQTTNLRSRLISAVGTPWTITTLLRQRFTTTTADRQLAGLVLRESGTSKLTVYYIQNSGNIQTVNYTNDTTFASVGPVNTLLPGALGTQWHWLRITDDGTNLHYLMSLDGINFVEMGSQSRTAHMAGGANQYGIFGNVDSSAASFDASFAHWLQT